MLIFLQILFVISILSFFFINKRYGIKIFLLLILFSMFLFPSVSIKNARHGYELWVSVIISSLLPFFILNDLMIYFEIPDALFHLFSKTFEILFKTSGYGAYVFILSIFSGYPTGAKIVSQLISEKKISEYEGQKILNFASTSGPLFVVGAVGAGMLKNEKAGYVIFISHILGAIANGILYSFFYKRTSKNIFNFKNKNEKTKNIFYSAITNSLLTTGLIGGYIIFFSVIIGIFEHIKLFTMLTFLLSKFLPGKLPEILILLFQSIIEISNGCNIIATSNLSLEMILILECFVISFSGVSIIMQAVTILHDCKINIKNYIISKFSHALLSSIICYILLKIRLFNSISVSNFNNIHMPNRFLLIQLMLIIILFSLLIYRIKAYYKTIKLMRK